MKCGFISCETEVKKGYKFCSVSCANLKRWGAKTKKGRVIIKTCTICGKQWEYTRATRGSVKGRGNKVCSWECRSKTISNANLGKTVSEETRRKLSKAKKGIPLTAEHRAAIGRGVSGPKNSHWIDGRSWEKEGAADYDFEFTTTLRTTVKRRDGHKCRKCSHDGSKFLLFVHHIDMNKKNNTVENLVTVCSSCHTRIHCGTLDNEFV